MKTEHTNQSRQAEPATHSPIALQSIPKRQRDFTAENIRDIAHECMRIGDNEQAAVVFAIADALRDGNLTIHPAAVAVRIRELEAQLNAATHARQEAQQIAQEAIEARNRAGVEIRRPLLKRIRELQAQQAEPVNQQLLALVKSFGHKTGCAKNAFGELCTCGADEAIAAAEKAQANHIGGVNEMAQQAEPVALIMCDGKSYDFMVTVEGQKRIPDTGEFVHLYAAQPPAVAVPEVWRDAIERAAEDLEDNNCLESAHQLRAMLAAAPQGADPIKRLIAMHNELLGEYPYCYFELAYTRRTDWMAWLCTKPREDDPERKVLACGQGLTAEEACAEAISAAQKGGAA